MVRPALLAAASLLATAQLGTASLVEVLWTLSGLAGAYFTWDNLRDARKYIIAIRKMNGQALMLAREMKVIAYGHYRNELFRMMMFGTIVVVGVVAMSTAPPNTPAHHHAALSITSVAITMGLFGIAALLVVASFLDRRQRDLMLDLSIPDRPGPPGPPGPRGEKGEQGDQGEQGEPG